MEEKNKNILLVVSNVIFIGVFIGLIFLLVFIRSDGGKCLINSCGYCKKENPGVSITKLKMMDKNPEDFDWESFNISEEFNYG